jgi:hypothetical protein
MRNVCVHLVNNTSVIVVNVPPTQPTFNNWGVLAFGPGQPQFSLANVTYWEDTLRKPAAR